MPHNKEEAPNTVALNKYNQPSQSPDILRELIESSRPKNILAVDIGESTLAAASRCIQALHLDCQVEYCAFSAIPQYLAAQDKKVDFLILNAVCNMPVELLNFLAVLPYLQENAIVVLQDAVLQEPESGLTFASSILFQSVTADKFPYNLHFYPTIQERIKLCGYHSAYPQYSHVYRSSYLQFPIMSAFRINANTRKYIGDIFSALHIVWPYVPDREFLTAYEELLAKHYTPEHLQLYRQAKEAADRSFNLLPMVFEMLQSFSFPHVLLYGAGQRGRAFLPLAKKAGLSVSGFIISDGRTSEPSLEGCPIYCYSQIPFHKDETLIILTADSRDIESLLRQSGYHWLKLPESFWRRAV